MSQANVFGTACKTCRRRGKKCDRSLPTCTSCSKRGVTCEGYNFRWVGVAARGPLAGQAKPVADDEVDSTPARKQRRSQVVETPDIDPDINHGEQLQGNNSDQAMVTSSTTSPESHTHIFESPASSAEDNDSQATAIFRQQNWSVSNVLELTGDSLEGLVQYYGRELSTAFYLGKGPEDTPYASHILPLVRSVPSVRCAVAALASCHLGNRLDEDQLKIQSLQLRLKATELLREDLMSAGDEYNLACLACMLLLAQLDLCSGDCYEFGTHLEAASHLLKLHGSDGTDRGFFEQRILWLDIMGSTTTSRMPYWTSKDIKATLNKFRTPSGREWGFDVFSCPIDLLEYIADITVLYKQNTAEIGEDTIQKAVRFGNAVKEWDAVNNDSDPRSHIVEVWRQGILLYLIRIFQLPNEVFNTSGLIDSIYHHVRATPVKKSWNVSTTWPLFQTGLLLSHKDEEAKNWIRTELLTNYQSLGCFNLNRGVMVLEQIWQMEKDEPYDFFTFGCPQHKLVL
ncbi:hypothetical protein BT63DRAFT_453340 [Microthyrium microscopicum]|uniref:Zn(2)-C6 fungal-type domain-containing protein n=1 Tax=Microthyrium microscopicum TaxID=703497 RepID=A0A6A6UIS2_9PEZI|nr:hypothetical protein BT63DRAFT_453340 [Microthyrium microscopicum]